MHRTRIHHAAAQPYPLRQIAVCSRPTIHQRWHAFRRPSSGSKLHSANHRRIDNHRKSEELSSSIRSVLISAGIMRVCSGIKQARSDCPCTTTAAATIHTLRVSCQAVNRAARSRPASGRGRSRSTHTGRHMRAVGQDGTYAAADHERVADLRGDEPPYTSSHTRAASPGRTSAWLQRSAAGLQDRGSWEEGTGHGWRRKRPSSPPPPTGKPAGGGGGGEGTVERLFGWRRWTPRESPGEPSSMW
jgi:hypothetical protein